MTEWTTTWVMLDPTATDGQAWPKRPAGEGWRLVNQSVSEAKDGGRLAWLWEREKPAGPSA